MGLDTRATLLSGPSLRPASESRPASGSRGHLLTAPGGRFLRAAGLGGRLEVTAQLRLDLGHDRIRGESVAVVQGGQRTRVEELVGQRNGNAGGTLASQ